MADTSDTSWDGILDPGEKILWQGRPGTRIALTSQDYAIMGVGGVFTGFALYWMAAPFRQGDRFWMFGLLHFSVGLGIALWPLTGAPFIRSRSWYTLTDRRAFNGCSGR